jgi:GT2 family glycosyltransferase
MHITVLLTCFNRRDKTISCIEALTAGNPDIHFDFVVVDDNSTDGTVEALQKLSEKTAIKIIHGKGNLYYSGGMRVGMDYILRLDSKPDYLLMVNDDVCFFDGCIEKLIVRSKKLQDAVIVGATCDEQGNLSYGAIRYLNKNTIKYRTIPPSDKPEECDTFNANCVLIPYPVFCETGSMDEHYVHSLGDFDYGLQMKKRGIHIYPSEKYVGVCCNNSIKGTWMDRKLPIRQRIRLKEQPKGAPFKCWFYFLHKNFGLGKAVIYSMTPYIRILTRR